DCDAPTLFSQIKRCDLFGVGEAEARERLAKFLEPAARPVVPQPFPGSARSETAANAVQAAVAKPPERQPFPGGTSSEMPLAAATPATKPKQFSDIDQAQGVRWWAACAAAGLTLIIGIVAGVAGQPVLTSLGVRLFVTDPFAPYEVALA